MRIYRMTATFGKLDHQELVLEPGLNVIHAPNEWGKSTWCAFLMAMLYGLDTRSKTTKHALADKEHYAPWSGRSMSGRIDLNWKGRDITIERRTKGRTPMGEFLAFETDTGLTVPELNAANCGQMLLGVEQSVFRRAGFIRLSDLPVTQDDALRERLNALVTTGDESGDGERLARGLKELKNKIRYNRSGLIPQAEAEIENMETTLGELDTLDNQGRDTRRRLEESVKQLEALKNHREHLCGEAAKEDARRVAQARDDRDRAAEQLQRLENICSKLPSREEAEQKSQQMKEFSKQWQSILMEQQLLPKLPLPPETSAPFHGMAPEAAVEMAKKDGETWKKLKKQNSLAFLILGGIAWAGAIGLLLMSYYLLAGLGGAVGIVAVLLWFMGEQGRKKDLEALARKYGGGDPEQWLRKALSQQAQMNEYRELAARQKNLRGDLESRMAALSRQKEALCGSQTPEKALDVWQEVLHRWDSYHAARREFTRAQGHLETLEAMAKPAAVPETKDDLRYSEEETGIRIAEVSAEQQNLRTRLGKIQGRMEALGDVETLENSLEETRKRIRRLEKTYDALTLAQEALNESRLELQRRFAPRISRRAQELLSAMTGGRYERLQLGEDLSLMVGTGEEETLHSSLWPSEGTVDQLYLALRLAVSEELTPQAPLILDDALVRFDDERMKAAMEILRKEAQTKQVILFSCQKREQEVSTEQDCRESGSLV